MEYDRRNVNSNCNNAAETLKYPPPAAAPTTKTCHGCKLPIEDEFSLRVAPDLEWHVACLVCTECHEFLDESCDTCFIKDGRPYCRTDYVKLFGMECSKCSESINSNTLVMRAENQIYHIDCFRCEACNKKLLTGEEFGVTDRKLYCKKDFESLSHDSLVDSLEELEATISLGEPLISSTNTQITSSIPHSTILSSSSSSSSCSSSIASTSSVPVSMAIAGCDSNPVVSKTTAIGGGDKPSRRASADQKTPRIRTVLTEQQLQTLRSVYQTNPRPDALLKEQLCELTGLSPRVIRVWFQNRRCKDKKKALQQAEVARMQQTTGTKILPMTPQTPMTPDGMSQVSPHGGMQAFTYPLPSYDQVTTPTLPPTPSHTCVSPNISYPNHIWHSPSETVCTFDHATVDFTSSHLQHTTDHQTYVYSNSSQSHLLQPTTITHFQY